MSDQPNNVEAQAASEAAPPAQKKLTDSDRLRIENLYLKVENLKLQQERLNADLIQATQMRQRMQQEMSNLQQELSSKYEMDLTKVKILADGTILPQTPQPTGN